MVPLSRVLGAALAAVASLILSAPRVLHTTAAVAFWLYIVDYITGVSSAALRRGPDGKPVLSSTQMRMKTQSKLLCYVQILALGAAAAALAQAWNWLIAAWGAVAASEAWSIVENLRASAVAPELAPVRILADKLANVLKLPTGAAVDPDLIAPSVAAVRQSGTAQGGPGPVTGNGGDNGSPAA